MSDLDPTNYAYTTQISDLKFFILCSKFNAHNINTIALVHNKFGLKKIYQIT